MRPIESQLELPLADAMMMRQLVGNLLLHCHELPRQFEQLLSCPREANNAAAPVKQHDTVCSLERFHLNRERGLRQPDGIGGGNEASRPGDSIKGTELGVEHRQSYKCDLYMHFIF